MKPWRLLSTPDTIAGKILTLLAATLWDQEDLDTMLSLINILKIDVNAKNENEQNVLHLLMKKLENGKNILLMKMIIMLVDL